MRLSLQRPAQHGESSQSESPSTESPHREPSHDGRAPGGHQPQNADFAEAWRRKNAAAFDAYNGFVACMGIWNEPERDW